MPFAQHVLSPTDSGVLNAATPAGLAEIHRKDCAAAIWNRTTLPRFQSWIDRLSPADLPQSRMILRPEMVCEALANIARVCGTPESTERDMLIDDMAALATIFADVMRSPFVRLRLSVVNNNACRKFHLDTLTARLVCTYRGTGTQYGISANGSDPQAIMTVPTGCPIVLRGKLWPETPLSGLLHRSPPIEGTGETRLVLVLDPIDDPKAEHDPILMH